MVGIVGAGGLGHLLTEQLSNFDFSGITSTIITLILLTLLVEILSSAVRRTIRMGWSAPFPYADLPEIMPIRCQVILRIIPFRITFIIQMSFHPPNQIARQ